jgi:hypothetical protein
MSKSPSHPHCERSEAIQNTVNYWIVSGCAFTMTLFISSILKGFPGLLHFVRNDEQRWFASIYDEAFCYVLTERHFAFSLGTERLFAMTGLDLSRHSHKIEKLWNGI